MISVFVSLMCLFCVCTCVSIVTAEEGVKAKPPSGVTAYCLLKCVKDDGTGEHYEEVYVGKDVERTVTNLLPGTAYSFRLQVVDAHGIVSSEGPPTVVVTPLKTPGAPAIVGRPAPCSVVLRSVRQ